MRTNLPRYLSLIFVGVSLLFCAVGCTCQKPEGESAKDELASYRAVANYLEPGHEFFMITTIEGEVDRFVGVLTPYIRKIIQLEGGQEAEQFPINIQEMVKTLGLSNVAGVGFSSRALPDTDLYHNRTFYYTQGGRQGLFLITGGEPRPLTLASRVPTNTWMLYEGELDLTDSHGTVLQALTAVAGPMGEIFAREGLAQSVLPKTEDSPNWEDLLKQGRFQVELALVVNSTDSGNKGDLSDIQSYLPDMDLYLQVTGPYTLFRKFIEKEVSNLQEVVWKDADTLYFVSNEPLVLDASSGIQWVPIIEISFSKNTLTVFSSPDFEARYRGGYGDSLENSADFQLANTGFPDTGNSRFYVSHDLLRYLRGTIQDIVNQRREEGAFRDSDEVVICAMLALIDEYFPATSGFAGLVRNEKEGILCIDNYFMSHRIKLLGGLLTDYLNPLRAGPLMGSNLIYLGTVRDAMSRADEVRLMNQLRMIGMAVMMYSYDHIDETKVSLKTLIDKEYLNEDVLPPNVIYDPDYVFELRESWIFSVESSDGRVYVVDHTGMVYEADVTAE